MHLLALQLQLSLQLQLITTIISFSFQFQFLLLLQLKVQLYYHCEQFRWELDIPHPKDMRRNSATVPYEPALWYCEMIDGNLSITYFRCVIFQFTKRSRVTFSNVIYQQGRMKSILSYYQDCWKPLHVIVIVIVIL